MTIRVPGCIFVLSHSYRVKSWCIRGQIKLRLRLLETGDECLGIVREANAVHAVS